MTIKKGDTVRVRTGDEKGKTGKVVRVLPARGRAVVEGLNLVKKHQRPRGQGKKGQVIDMAMPLPLSVLVLADAPKKKPKAK
jgi:large subunit ribosomal protein L24